MSAIDLGKVVSQLNELQTNYENIRKTINALKLDIQKKVDGNVQIPPGVATKVSFDINGLILKGSKLEASDIPPIGIDVVEGLRTLLDSKASKKDIENLEAPSISEIFKKGAIVGSGSIVNFDANGLVVSASNLTPLDIPDLPISKIEGLSEIIDLLKATTSGVSEHVSYDKPVTSPGTYTKITYDANGRVLSGSDLTMNDLPRELITQVNEIESKIPSLASQRSVDALNNEMVKKIDGNESIIPGIFTKVRVDSKGLITGGENLTKRDLPELDISDINNLEITLRRKCDQEDFINLSDTVSGIVGSLSKISDINSLQTKVEGKASQESVVQLSNKVDSIKKLVDTILDNIPSDLILTKLNSIEEEISNLSGRISVLENKVKQLER